MERPHPGPSEVLARPLDLANLRVQLRLAENLVAGLDEFEREWGKFVAAMYKILKVCEEDHVAPWVRVELDDLLKKTDDIRLDLASRQQIVLPEFRDPLAKILRTSVRTYSDDLWSLIGVTARGRDGTLMVPIGDNEELVYQVSLKNFEINVAEAQGEITRRRRILNEDVSKLKVMLEEAERAQAGKHNLESPIDREDNGMARGRREELEQIVTGRARSLNIERLREGLAAIPKWKETRDSRPPEFENWKSRTTQSLGAVFGKGHDYYRSFNFLSFCVPRMVFPGGRSWEPMDVIAFDRDIAKAESILTDALAEIHVVEGEGGQPAPPTPTKSGNDVFIVHGHDETNLYRLRDLIRDRYKLHPVILKWEAGQGRALIDKFEQEADRCGYAFVLLTPDDQIVAPDGQYTQARPNVVFELGWFYGRLRRSRVVILLKKGAKLHSDLDGISRIEFVESVEEKVIDIERELRATGLLSQ